MSQSKLYLDGLSSYLYCHLLFLQSRRPGQLLSGQVGHCLGSDDVRCNVVWVPRARFGQVVIFPMHKSCGEFGDLPLMVKRLGAESVP